MSTFLRGSRIYGGDVKFYNEIDVEKFVYKLSVKHKVISNTNLINPVKFWKNYESVLKGVLEKLSFFLQKELERLVKENAYINEMDGGNTDYWYKIGTVNNQYPTGEFLNAVSVEVGFSSSGMLFFKSGGLTFNIVYDYKSLNTELAPTPFLSKHLDYDGDDYRKELFNVLNKPRNFSGRRSTGHWQEKFKNFCENEGSQEFYRLCKNEGLIY